MNQSGNMLVVADGPDVSRLTGSLGTGKYVRCDDPYDALMKMSRRSWSTVVLAAPRAGFAGLCRATRRLQQNAKLFALCPPSCEADVRPLTGEVLDDYFICPPTENEIRLIAKTALGVQPQETPKEQSTALGSREIGEMVQAAQSVADLEAHIAIVVSRRLGLQVEWQGLERSPANTRALLVAAGDMPRVLVTDGQTRQLEEPARQYLAALQECLPALIASAKRTESLYRQAITDYLTDAYNRRYFYQVTDQILTRQRANGSRVALLLFDIDDFKRYNDTYGHAAGDDILREVARLIRQTTRTQDIVARIGGDEFAVLFWDNSGPRQINSELPTTAQMMAERFRKSLREHNFPSLGPAARGVLTVSGGLAAFPSGGRTCRELLRSADKALRDTKASGKDAIRIVGS